MSAMLWQPVLVPHKYVNIQIRLWGTHVTEVLDQLVFREEETQVSFVHRLLMPGKGGKRCFSSTAIVVRLLYSRPAVPETKVGEARSGKRYRRPHFDPF